MRERHDAYPASQFQISYSKTHSNCSERSTPQRQYPLLLAGVFAGVEPFFGEGAVVAFGLLVVFRDVRLDAIVSSFAE